jgi:hypothetical protein
MNIRRRFVPYLAALLALAATARDARAVVFSDGSASVWTYLRNDSSDHALVVPTFSFTAADPRMKALRFEGSLRGYTDVRGGKSEERSLRILRGVLVYAPEEKLYELRLGQQWLTEGVGRGNVAGAWLRYRFDKRTSLTIYGGSRIAESISLQETNRYQGYTLGLNARAYLQPFNVGASYYYLGKSGDLLYHAAGLDANGRLSRSLAVRGRFEMNVEQADVERAQVLADWRARRNVQVTGEFRSQAPRVFEDSYFTIFLSEASTTFGRANVRWEFRKPFYARAGGTMLFSEHPDPLYKVQLALGHRFAEIGYTHWLSVATGVMDGVFVQGNYRFRDRYDVFAGYDWARGSNADSDLRPITESHAAYFGGSADICRTLSVTARAEQVRDVERKSDWRGLLGVTARFSNLR